MAAPRPPPNRETDAAFTGDLKLVKRLASELGNGQGCEMDFAAAGGNTPPLFCALVCLGYPTAVYLIENGVAAIDCINHLRGHTALHLAAKTGHEHEEIMRLLLSKGVKVEHDLNITLRSPLEWACAQLLLDNGADVAGRSSGELVRKLGERVLLLIIPILSLGLTDDPSCRQGVRMGLSEVMASAGKCQLLSFIGELIPAIRTALCDSAPDVREAGLVFSTLYKSAGMQAIDEIVPTLLHALEDDQTCDTAVDGLKQILSVRTTAVLPHILPKLVRPPLTAFSAHALGALAEVAGPGLDHHLDIFLLALLFGMSDAHEDVRGFTMKAAESQALAQLFSVIPDRICMSPCSIRYEMNSMGQLGSQTAIMALRLDGFLFLGMESMQCLMIGHAVVDLGFQLPPAEKGFWLTPTIAVAGSGSAWVLIHCRCFLWIYLAANWDLIHNMRDIAYFVCRYLRGLLDWSWFPDCLFDLTIVGSYDADPSIYVVRRVGNMIEFKRCKHYYMTGCGARHMIPFHRAMPRVHVVDPHSIFTHGRSVVYNCIVHAIRSSPETCGGLVRLITMPPPRFGPAIVELL